MARKKETALRDRVGEFVCDLTDRRRLAVAKALMIAEASGDGSLTQYQFGMCVIENALPDDDDDVMALSDATNRRLAEIAYGGY